jgi:hypothetical protein
MIKRNNFVNLFRVVEDALADMGDLSEVQMVIPIAWPVFEVEHRLHLRLEEELALVERNILEAVARFGPASPEQIGEMMGLDGDVVEHLMEKLERFPDVILREGNMLRTTESVLGGLSENRWTRETTQPYGFWVNGPTGRLLPLKSIGKYASDIDVDLESGGGVISRAGQNLDTMYWIAPSQGLGCSHIDTLVKDFDLEKRTKFGVPEGAFAVESSKRQSGGIRWEFAIGELVENQGLRIRLAKRPDVILVDAGPASLQSFGEMLRRGNKTFQHLGKADSKGASNREMVPSSWSDFADCKISGGNLVISLKRLDVIPFWEQAADDDGERNESDMPSAKVPRDLPVVLGRPHFWHPYHFTVRQVVPGDSDTAAVMLKRRALGLLRKLADQNPDGIDFESWWEKTRLGIVASWPENARPQPISWSDIRDIALRSPDGDLVEFVSESL